MFRKFSHILILLCLIPTVLYPYKDKKAILLVNKESQNDSLGYNIVNDFLSYSYSLIKDGKVKLWDSPLKSNPISYLSLNSIEESNNVSFEKSDNFFIYEEWSSNGKESSFKIIGFAITTETTDQKEVSFGFIDFYEISDYLKTGLLKVGINAYFGTNLFQVLMNKEFNYDILFFDDTPLINPSLENQEKAYLKGLKIKNKAFGSDKVNLNHVDIKSQKLISIKLDRFEYSLGSFNIINSIEDYFNTNKETLSKLQNYSVANLFYKSKLIVTQCQANILYSKTGDKISKQLISITPYSFNIAFEPIYMASLDTLLIFVDSVKIDQYLLQEEYSFKITGINEVPVNMAKTEKLIQEIIAGNWKRLGQIIKEN